jgi:mono/diheme cytochrome c family protein
MSLRERLAAIWQFVKRQLRPMRLLIIVSVIVIVSLLSGFIAHKWAFWDDDKDRGATTVQGEIFGDAYSSVRYLQQGWDPSQSLWYYNTTQGSDLLPYDFFMVLEKLGTDTLIRSASNMNAYRYLPRKKTFWNPDSLAVGFVKDSYQGNDYLGLTCAACHTSQLNYKGVGIRVDGGPGAADMDGFIKDVQLALRNLDSAGKTPAHDRFVKNVLARGSYKSDSAINADLSRYSNRIGMYRLMNHPETPYGYARLDAFGRIYNRVLEHVVNGPALGQALSALWLDGRITEAQYKAIMADSTKQVLTQADRDEWLKRVVATITPRKQKYLLDKLFNKPTAPVSYPFLWDIPQHDYVQWNAVVSNAGLGPVGRNTGEAVGVFATLDWSQQRGLSLPAFITGQGLYGTHVSFKSSVDVGHLRQIERQLAALESPRWEDKNSPLPPIDTASADRGKHQFDRYCASCHTEINRSDPNRRVVAHISNLEEAGTDPTMALNSAQYSGLSGILQNQYVGTTVGDVLLDGRAPVAMLLTKAVTGVVATPDPDHWWPRRGWDWARELVTAFFTNDIKPSIRRGKYNPDNTVDPFASIVAYKARSLNGIWATAPYLHNGSVPTLYDLLLPPRPPVESLPPGWQSMEFRPDSFRVGSREFDPDKVGFKTIGYEGFLFRTKLPGNVVGNSNAGHVYPRPCPMPLKQPATAPKAVPLKVVLKGDLKAAPVDTVKPEDAVSPVAQCGLGPKERKDLLEYLKRL